MTNDVLSSLAWFSYACILCHCLSVEGRPPTNIPIYQASNQSNTTFLYAENWQ